MKHRKTLIICLLLVLAVSLIGAFSVASAEELPAVKGQDYAIVLEDYEIANYNNGVTVINPNGKTEEVADGKFLPRIIGDYSIKYPNGITKLTVLKTRPEITFNIDGEVKTEYKAGDLLEITRATVSGGVGGYSQYQIELKKNNKQVFIVNGSKNVSYMFKESGVYVLSYVYNDIYATKCTATKTFILLVFDEKRIVANDLPEQVDFGSTINIGTVFGISGGKIYSGTVTVDSPDGTEVVSDINYYPQKTGKYTFNYSVDIDGQTLSEQKVVNVTASYAGLFGKSNMINKISPDVDLPSYSFDKGKSIYVEAQPYTTGSSLYFGKIIDLRTLDKEMPIVSFIPYSDEFSYMSNFRITLEDVYDSSNYFSVYYWYSKSVSAHSYTSVYLKGRELGALCNESYLEDYNKIRKTYGSVNWEGYFNAFKEGQTCRDFNISYDIGENALYARRLGSLEKLIDFDDAGALGYSNIWSGFTTGEVYLKFEFTNSAKTEAIYIEKIAGKSAADFAAEELKNETCFIVVSDYAPDAMPDGVVNCAYPIPEYLVNSKISDIKVDVKLYCGSQDITDAIKNNSFVPDKTGNYSIVYSATDNLGKDIIKTYTFKVSETKTPIEVTIGDCESKLFEYFTLPDINITGGNGNVSYVATLLYEGNALPSSESYLIDKTGSYELQVVATDYVGNTVTAKKKLTIDKKGLLSIKLSAPVDVVRAGKVLNLPEFEAIDYETDKSLVKTIEIVSNGTVIKKIDASDSYSYTVPNDVDRLTFNFYGGKGTEKQVLYSVERKVLPAKITNTSDLFDYDNKSVSSELLYEGLVFSSVNNKTISYPSVLPVSGLEFSIGVLETEKMPEKLTIRFTDASDSSVSADFVVTNLKTSPVVEVNGDGKNYTAPVTTEKFSANCGGNNSALSSKYGRTNYYNLEGYYDSTLNRLCTLSGEMIATIGQLKNGLSFTDFPSGLVYVSVIAEGASSDSKIIIKKLGNQSFSNLIEEIGYSDFDTAGPNFWFEETMKDRNMNENDKFVSSVAKAYDVITGQSKVTIKVVSPSGKTVVNGDASSKKEIVLSEFGTYEVIYSALDKNNNESVVKYSVIVTDKEKPVLTVNGNLNGEYNVGDEITIPSATATDNQDSSVNISAYVKNPYGELQRVQTSESYKFTEKGTYIISVVATDSSSNSSRKTFKITVK